MVYLIILAFVVWAISWIVRRKNAKAGQILSWVATGIAAVGLVIYFVTRIKG